MLMNFQTRFEQNNQHNLYVTQPKTNFDIAFNQMLFQRPSDSEQPKTVWLENLFSHWPF